MVHLQLKNISIKTKGKLQFNLKIMSIINGPFSYNSIKRNDIFAQLLLLQRPTEYWKTKLLPPFDFITSNVRGGGVRNIHVSLGGEVWPSLVSMQKSMEVNFK